MTPVAVRFGTTDGDWLPAQVLMVEEQGWVLLAHVLFMAPRDVVLRDAEVRIGDGPWQPLLREAWHGAPLLSVGAGVKLGFDVRVRPPRLSTPTWRAVARAMLGTVEA